MSVDEWWHQAVAARGLDGCEHGLDGPKYVIRVPTVFNVSIRLARPQVRTAYSNAIYVLTSTWYPSISSLTTHGIGIRNESVIES